MKQNKRNVCCCLLVLSLLLLGCAPSTDSIVPERKLESALQTVSAGRQARDTSLSGVVEGNGFSDGCCYESLSFQTTEEGKAVYSPEPGTGTKLIGCSIVSEGADKPCFLLSDDTALSLENCTAISDTCLFDCSESLCFEISVLKGVTDLKQGILMRMGSGEGKLTILGCSIAGSIEAEDPSLAIAIGEGARWIGSADSEDFRGISVSFYADGVWELTSDTRIGMLPDGPKTAAHIFSNGFNLYYDSSLEENAELNSGTYALQGGGFLIPLI